MKELTSFLYTEPSHELKIALLLICCFVVFLAVVIELAAKYYFAKFILLEVAVLTILAVLHVVEQSKSNHVEKKT